MGKRFWIALTGLLCLLAYSHAFGTTLLSVSNDGGASNRTATSAYLSGSILVTNGAGLVLTNIFYDWPDVGTTNIPATARATTNLTISLGLVQTNLTMPYATNRRYIFSSLDLSGQVYAASTLAFSLPSSASSSNLNTFMGTATINTNTGAVQVNMPAGSGITVAGVPLGSSANSTNLANGIGDANINITTNAGAFLASVSNKSTLFNLIANPVTNPATVKSVGAITNNDTTTQSLPNTTVSNATTAATATTANGISATGLLSLSNGFVLANLKTNDVSGNAGAGYVPTFSTNGGIASVVWSNPPTAQIDSNLTSGTGVFVGNTGNTNTFRVPISGDTSRMTIIGNASNLVFTPSSTLLLNAQNDATLGRLSVTEHLTLSSVANGSTIFTLTNGFDNTWLNFGIPEGLAIIEFIPSPGIGSFQFDTNVVANGTVTAVKFIGDGSALTGLSAAAATNLQVVLGKTPEAGNMAGLIISNGVITNVTIKAVTFQGNVTLTNNGSLVANGMYSNGGFNVISGVTTSPVVNGGNVNLSGMTNGMLTNVASTVYRAEDYLRFDGSDDTTNLIRLIAATATNAIVIFPAKTATIATNWNGLTTVINLNFLNVAWIGNNILLNMTKSNVTCGSGFFNVENTKTFYKENLNFAGPVIPTNDTLTTCGGWFQYNASGGTNQDVITKHCSYAGLRFGEFVGPNGGVNLGRLHYYDITGSNIGNRVQVDGAIIAASAVDFYINGLIGSNCYRFVEQYMPATGQTNCSTIVENVYGQDWMDVGFASANVMPSDSIILRNWHLSSPSLAANTIYAGNSGVSIQTTLYGKAQDIYIATPYNNGNTFTANNALEIDNFQCTNCAQLNTVTAPQFAIQHSNFGSLSIAANSTGTLINVGSVTYGNAGIVKYIQDPAGNVTVSGTNTSSSVLVFQGNFIGNSMVLSNTGSIGAGGFARTTNYAYLVDTSAGAQSNWLAAVLDWPINASHLFVKTNAQANPFVFDGKAGVTTVLLNGSRYSYLSNQWDVLRMTKIDTKLFIADGGNVNSNQTALHFYYPNGTELTNTVDSGGSTGLITNLACTAGSTLLTNTFGKRVLFVPDIKFNGQANGGSCASLSNLTSAIHQFFPSSGGLAMSMTGSVFGVAFNVNEIGEVLDVSPIPLLGNQGTISVNGVQVISQ